jgi:hypothetical protein
MKKFNPFKLGKKAFNIIVVSFILLLAFWGSFMISTGVLLGLLTLAGFYVMYNRLSIVRKFSLSAPGFFDIGAALLTYLMFGSTVIGLIAAAIVGLGTSMLLDYEIQRVNEQKLERCNNVIAMLQTIT